MKTYRLFPLTVLVLTQLISTLNIYSEDGYQLWLRYKLIENETVRADYQDALNTVSFPANSKTLKVARSELELGLIGLLGRSCNFLESEGKAHVDVIISTPHNHPELKKLNLSKALEAVGDEGFIIDHFDQTLVLTANTDQGILYGVFELLRLVQTEKPIQTLSIRSRPKIKRRMLNHWDNLDRTVERGYAGSSLWNWFTLPDYLDPRYTDYARACASVGINGTVLTNVNANARVLTEQYLTKVAALANVFRPFGLKVYLTARFSAPSEIGELPTSDPLDPNVQQWWKNKADEIYAHIPDFGGFLVKANSEGQPGPQDYERTHAEGANALAIALKPHGGVVIWRAFVYDHNVPDDRSKQAYNEFQPMDGSFEDNVFIQIKNGPIDFMPREPFHPLFGAMPQTRLSLELQITQEYLGASTQLAFLAPMWKEVLAADTYRSGRDTQISKIVDGTIDQHNDSAIAGVSNIGSDRNWCGHPLASSNWYAFGRLAWDHSLSSSSIAEEWVRQSFGNSREVVSTLSKLLLGSHQTVVNYSMPLGLHHIMAQGHHHGPGPWVDGIRADWTSVYYHQADENGIGFDRTKSGSNAIAQYAPEVANTFGNLETCPENYLLWFHHVNWDHKMSSGNTLWDEMCFHYQQGVDDATGMIQTWNQLSDQVDSERFVHTQALFNRQFKEAKEWRDACLLYFQTFSKRPFPKGVSIAEKNLETHMKKRKYYVPGN